MISNEKLKEIIHNAIVTLKAYEGHTFQVKELEEAYCSLIKKSGVFKHTLTIEILSDQRSISDWDLDTIARQITSGDCSGYINFQDPEELTLGELQDECDKHGSNIEFFIMGD